MLEMFLSIKAGAKWKTYANKNLVGLERDCKAEIGGPDGNVLKEIKFKLE